MLSLASSCRAGRARCTGLPFWLGQQQGQPSEEPDQSGQQHTGLHTQAKRPLGLHGLAQQQQQLLPRAGADPWHNGIACRGFFQGRGAPDWFRADRLVTNTLISLNVVAFLLEMNDPAFIQRFAQINVLLDARGEYYRILSAAFLHSGPLHLLGNMLSLHWIAPQVEQTLGRPCFLLVYLASAASAGLMHYMMGPAYGSLVGASGAVLGLLAATLVFKLRNRRFVPMTSGDFNWIGQIIMINAALAMFTVNVSHWGHLGGFLGGALAMFLFGPRYKWGHRGIVSQPLIPWFKQ